MGKEMEYINASMLTLALVALLVVFVLFSSFRKPKGDDVSLKNTILELKANLDARDAELRESNGKAYRFEAVVEERTLDVSRLKDELTSIGGKLDEGVEKHQALNITISRLQAEMKATVETSNEKIRFLLEVRADMEAKFKDLASEALKIQGEQFSKSNMEKIQATLTPLKEHVGHFENELKAVHKATIDDRALLKAEISQLSQRSEMISKEAIALTRALKADQQKQGAWGEMILETILERSGLREGYEYEKQAHRTGESGERLRPDIVVNIPGGKTLIIDSKVSLVAYTDIVGAEIEAEALIAQKRHVVSFKSHINVLASKDYQNAEDTTVDYVIMFVPIEGALSEALRNDPKITEFAIEKNVTIATPTTLMMALKTVANVWAVERRNQNSEVIARRAGLLYEKVVGFVSNMENVGKRLDQAQGEYNDAFGKLSQGRGNLLSQVENLKKLGAKTGKSIGVDFDQDDGDATLIESTS